MLGSPLARTRLEPTGYGSSKLDPNEFIGDFERVCGELLISPESAIRHRPVDVRGCFRALPRFQPGSDHEKKAETEPIRLTMLPHLLFSVIDPYVEIFSRAVIRAVPVLSNPLRRIANLFRAQLKKGAFLEKCAELFCGRVGEQIHYLLSTKVAAMTNAELLHGWLRTKRQRTQNMDVEFQELGTD
jgi:hypothetical protein